MKCLPTKIPTGIAQFDHIINDGFPAGSLVLLLGEVGAGQQEFAYTSAAAIALAKYMPDLSLFENQSFSRAKVPENIHYITFSRDEQQVKNELKSYFDSDYFDAFQEWVEFKGGEELPEALYVPESRVAEYFQCTEMLSCSAEDRISILEDCIEDPEEAIESEEDWRDQIGHWQVTKKTADNALLDDKKPHEVDRRGAM